jgi:hypothetical protein
VGFVIVILAVAPWIAQPARAQSTSVSQLIVVPQDRSVEYVLRNATGDETFRLSIRTDGDPVDILLLDPTNLELYQNGASFHAYAPPTRVRVLSETVNFSVHGPGNWFLVIDNTAQPPQGAYAGRDVEVQLVLEQTSGTGILPGSSGAAPSIENALLFASPFWLVTDSWAIAGLTLWMIVLAGIAWPRDRRVLYWTGGVTLAAFLFSWPDQQGILVRLGPPIAVGGAVGVLTALRARSPFQGIKAAYFATFVGTLLGGDILSILLKGVTISPGVLGVIGGAQAEDALFVGPVTAVLWSAGISGICAALGLGPFQQGPPPAPGPELPPDPGVFGISNGALPVLDGGGSSHPAAGEAGSVPLSVRLLESEITSFETAPIAGPAGGGSGAPPARTSAAAADSALQPWVACPSCGRGIPRPETSAANTAWSPRFCPYCGAAQAGRDAVTPA